MTEKLSRIRPSEVGIDRAGDVWFWFRGSGQVWLHSSTGLEKARQVVPQSHAVAVDSEWGIVSLGYDERLTFTPLWTGEPRSFDLPGPSTSLAWLRRDEIALTPREPGHAVWIFSLVQGLVTQRIGPEPERSLPESGLVLDRSNLLRFDSRRGRLWVVDRASGLVRLLSLADGQQLSVDLGANYKLSARPWLENLDREARREKERKVITIITWPAASLDDTGALWMVRACSEDQRTATMVRIDAHGESQTLDLGGADCCTRSVIWTNHSIVHYAPSETEPTACSQPRRTK